MATALQQQLAQIAANSTHQLDLKAQKARHGKSLLFEPRDAASQSFDTIFQLCWEGYAELCQLDGRFAPFSRNLFSEQSKTEDRTQMTAAEVNELDAVIEQFLGLLSGRLLLRPAMKAAEWLVRRFRIQEYNTEAVLFAFLPYHSSPIFTTLLSILPDQLPVTFRFLHPYVTSLQCPPRHVVVAAMTGNTNLITVFSTFVFKTARARSHATLVLGFWASILAQSVNIMIDSSRSGREAVRRQKEEDLLLRVLPILQSALSIRDVPELYLGSCMIITIIASKASVVDKVVDAMMEAVTAAWDEQTMVDGLTCLAVLAEEKEQPSLPRPVQKAILKLPKASKHLLRVAEKCRAGKLFTGILLHLIEDAKTGIANSLLENLFDSDALTIDQRINIIAALTRKLDTAAVENQTTYGEHASVIGKYIEMSTVALPILDGVSRQISMEPARLRLLLNLAEVPTQALEDQSAPDGMELDDDTKDNAAAPDHDLKALAGLAAETGTSYLASDAQKAYTGYAPALRRLSDLKVPVSRLLHVIQNTTGQDQMATFTFLAKFWTSDSSIKARIKALDLTKAVLTSSPGLIPSSTDLQYLLPYLVSTLAHDDKGIRQAAIGVCTSMDSIYRTRVEASKPSTDLKRAHALIYGKAGGHVQWLSHDDIAKFLSEGIRPILEECAVDGGYVVRALADILEATSQHNNVQKKELKSSLRTNVATFFISHVPIIPVPGVQTTLLDIISRLGKVAHPSRSKVLVPYARKCFSDSTSSERLKAALVRCMTHRSSEELDLLKDMASGDLSSRSSDAQISLGRLRHIWHKISPATQSSIADWLLALSIDDRDAEDFQSEAIEAFRTINFSSEVLVHLLKGLPRAADLQDQTTPAKRQRTGRTTEVAKSGEADKSKISSAIRKLTLILEVIEQSNPEKHPPLLKELFSLMSDLHHYKALLNSELVYLQGLIVNSLLAVVKGLSTTDNKDVDRSVIRADLIVECVRTTSSTQIHHAALLLMSALASWAPDLVLHSVMPLFTFMSSTILKQGDDYSAHVTEQTVTQVIPPLAASLKKRGKDLITGAADLLLSFTAAFEHIPLHRRAGIFRHLVQTLGPDESLFAIVAMLVERYPESTAVLPFINDLMAHFPVLTQMLALKQYMALVFETTKAKRNLPDVILGFTEKSADEREEATSVLLDGLAHILARDAFRKQVVKQFRHGGDEADRVRLLYAELLQQSMDLSLLLSSDADSEGRTSADDVLTALLGVLPTPDFIDSNAQLMQAGSDEMRRQVFASLEQRVGEAKIGNAQLQKVFIDVLPNCTAFLDPSQPELTRRAAIMCIDQISEKFGKTDRDAVLDAAKHIAGPAALGSGVDFLQVASLLCLASMVEVLMEGMIPVLPMILSSSIRFLSDLLASDQPDPSLHRAAYSFLTAVIDYVPWMLSAQDVDKLLILAARSITAGNQNVDTGLSKQFCLLVAKKVSAKDSFGAVLRVWETTVSLGPTAALQLIETFGLAIQTHTKATISKHTGDIFKSLLNSFDLRRRFSSVADPDEVSRDVFSLVDRVAMDVVLKLNDATFRPFFLSLVDWTDELKSQFNQSDMLIRATSLYSFAHLLFDQLKSLVTGYYAYLLDQTVSLLSNIKPTTPTETNLHATVLLALTSSFQHDQDGFWQAPAHFNAIFPPLVRLLGHAPSSTDSGTATTADLTTTAVIPALTDLAAAAGGSAEHYKALNAAVMAQMRSARAGARLAAVQCERAITARLGLDWLALLPEMLPFISELQEDDDAAVEREVLRWNAQIEGVTGESLDHMLR